MSKPATIKIDEVEYVRADSVSRAPAGNRAIVVVDRGWIFAGDVTRKDGRLRMDNAVHVFGWKSVGFAGIVADASKADLRPMARPVDLPEDAEIFSVPVSDTWGCR